MEPDKVILHKLWNNKWSRWILIFGLGWQVVTGVKEPGILLYNYALKPIAIYLSGLKPAPDTISSERHAFMSGYYCYEIFKQLKNNTYNSWPQEIENEKNRLESSLVALGMPNATLANEIDPTKTLDALEKYQRLRHYVESFLDKKSHKELSSFYLGLNIALLIEESGSNSPSKITIEQYLSEAKKLVQDVRSGSSHRLPILPFEELVISKCCADYEPAFVDSFLTLKKYYGINIK